MQKCFASSQNQRPQRRTHGIQLPLNYLQVLGWVVFVITSVFNFILINVQFDELRLVSIIVYSILYVLHIISHSAALLLDPGEEELRKQEINKLPEFDRTIHAHVIENGRCHLCNINTSNKKTKHCGICNKCVYHFDHHCKWLNNCVGRRNYSAFIVCVTTALLIGVFTSILCITDIVLFFKNPKQFSTETQHFINCTQGVNSNSTNYCRNSICFLAVFVFFCVGSIAISCALMHLLSFHIYISILGVSTYEYIIRNVQTNPERFHCCRLNIRNSYIISSHKSKQSVNEAQENQQNTMDYEKGAKSILSTLINEEIAKAKNVVLFKNTKVYPQSNDRNS